MKKFLSLVLALVMTMSLVTIGAGATEYKDLTDKGDIQYSEAVAVLNKLGIITGYEDGSFKPTGALTRGAAAKIIVSLMIGPSAASNLTVAAAPYKDVPVTNTFAAVISYCKTAGYISGYSDGTFRPTGALTGYAFSKMLLGALGYKADVEGFTGLGWTMNVAKIGNVAGLFNSITGFSGNAGIDRQTACQLGLNTLKATEVTYDGQTVSVTTGNANVVVGNNKSYPVTSSNTDINGNIDSTTEYNGNKTLQFAEEHFSDLKIVNGQYDSFVSPATQWNYKNVKVGSYAKKADFTFTSSISGDTLADKVRNMGINGYTLANTVKYFINGYDMGTVNAMVVTGATTDLEKVASLCGKGTTVKLYNTTTTANTITDVVVINTQMMQIDKINTSNKTVTLKLADGASKVFTGATVNTVKEDNDSYSALAAMKADDYVIVTPVATSTVATTCDVDSYYTPTVASGKLTSVKLNDTNNATTGVTVGGTAYDAAKVSCDKFASVISVTPNTTTDTSVYLDSFGFAKYVKNVDAETKYAVLADKFTSLVDGKLITMFTAITSSGETVSFNVGSGTTSASMFVGDVVTYKSATSGDSAKGAEYTLTAKTGATVNYSNENLMVAGYITPGGDISASDTRLNGSTAVYDSSVNFVFLKNTDGVYSLSSNKVGVQKVTGTAATSAVALFSKTGSNWRVTTVFVFAEDDNATGTDVAYVSAKTGSSSIGSKAADIYTLYIGGAETKNCISTNTGLAGQFVTYTTNSDGSYTLKAYSKTDSTTSVRTDAMVTARIGNLITVDGVELNANSATVIDLTDAKTSGSVSDLVAGASVVSVVLNGNTSSDAYKTVSYIFVTDNTAIFNLTAQTSGVKFYSDLACTTEITSATATTTVYMQAAAVNETISSATPYAISVDTAAGAAVKEIAHFTMPAAMIVATEFTEA